MSEVEEAVIEWICNKDDDDATLDVNVAGAFSNWEKLSMSKSEGGKWGIRFFIYLCILYLITVK